MKKLNKCKKGRKLFTSFIINNVIFMIIIAIIFFVSMVFLGYELNRRFNGKPEPRITAESLVRADYKNTDISDLLEVDGWMEIIKDNKVIYVKGHKLTNEYSYSNDEILKLVSNYGRARKYIYSTASFKGKDNEKYLCMTIIPNDKVHIGYTYSYTKLSNKVYNMPSYMRIILKCMEESLLFFVAFVLLSIVVYSIIISKWVAKPLKLINRGIASMTEGDLDVRLNFKAPNEIGKIRDAFNYMAEKLQKSENEKIEIEDSKKMMIVNISHDLKTPITSIQGYARALSDGVVDTEEKREKYLKIIYDKSVKMTGLIEELFKFAKLDSSTYELTKEKCDFVEFVREVVAMSYEEIEDKGFKLDLNLPDYVIVANIDKKEMDRVITNIISNSMKYNKEGTTIKVGLYKNGLGICLVIGDDGVGISSELKENIFDEFVRGDAARKSDGGSGLGLAIAKKIIEMHGGSIKLESNSEKGVSFRIYL